MEAQMKLRGARVIGYQSFGDSGDVEFSDGINLLVGQNNAGKSALLRAMQPSLADDRHRTPDRWQDFRLSTPEVQLTIGVTGQELRDALLQRGQTFVPVPEGGQVEPYMNVLLAEPAITVSITHQPGASFTAPYPGHGHFRWAGVGQQFCALVQPNGGELRFSPQYRGDDSTALVLHEMWGRNMFYFSAERMNVGVSAAAPASRLDTNAQNLPSVLFTLNGDRGDLFQKLVRHLREVFSTVGNVSVRPLAAGTAEIRIWPTEAREQVELSFPLLQSGTGVSQVMAILAAVMTVEHAVIMIDEINSFLHPAAVKALLRILQIEYAQHQYIISTHAPEVIGFSNPRTIHLVKRDGYESTIAKLDLDHVDAFREVAGHLGVSMADVFGADRVIWVEGPTEELCFPLLYQQAANHGLPRGTIFTSVMATGDFMAKRRDKELVYQIYQRLSRAAVPLVVGVAFSFDSENLSEPEKEKMVHDSQRSMHFLPRRHVECYLINADAIASFINEKDPDTDTVEPNVVTTKLRELADTLKFKIPEWNNELSAADWAAKVDAANLITDTCAQLSDHRVTFNKKDDTLALLQLVQAVDPNQTIELAEYVHGLVEAVA
jgi:predicted ATPase